MEDDMKKFMYWLTAMFQAFIKAFYSVKRK